MENNGIVVSFLTPTLLFKCFITQQSKGYKQIEM